MVAPIAVCLPREFIYAGTLVAYRGVFYAWKNSIKDSGGFASGSLADSQAAFEALLHPVHPYRWGFVRSRYNDRTLAIPDEV